MLDKTWSYLTNHFGYLDDLREASRAEVQALRTLPPIICLCGSNRYREVLAHEAAEFTLQGHIVLAPHVFGREEGEEDKPGLNLVTEEQKSLLDALHFRKIDLAQRVHVVNATGYIGKSTHNEIMYAVRHDKIVTFYEPYIQPLHSQHASFVTTAHYLQGIRDRVAFEA